MKLKDLREKRDRLVAEMRSIADDPKGENGDLSDDQVKQFDERKGEMEGIESHIERQQLIDDAERRMNGEKITGTGDDQLAAELNGYSLRKAILSQMPGHSEDCGREREMSAEIARRAGRPFEGLAVPLSVFHEPVEKRVITTGLPAAGPGSNIIATDYLGNQFIDRLRAALRVRALGATVLSGLVGNADIPRHKASAASGWPRAGTRVRMEDVSRHQIRRGRVRHNGSRWHLQAAGRYTCFARHEGGRHGSQANRDWQGRQDHFVCRETR